jgi:hypothetical protein
VFHTEPHCLQGWRFHAGPASLRDGPSGQGVGPLHRVLHQFGFPAFALAEGIGFPAEHGYHPARAVGEGRACSGQIKRGEKLRTRVADASVMLAITSTNTNAANDMMIAEKHTRTTKNAVRPPTADPRSAFARVTGPGEAKSVAAQAVPSDLDR